jgi:DNA-binding HxlR family transcriptional regulator
MPLPRDYAGQACSLASCLEVIGERWTLLIVRDAIYGVRRFSDFLAHLSIPKAVLTERLAGLVAAGILERVPGPGGHDEYALTSKGQALWPAMHALMAWGDQYYAGNGPRRLITHAACGATVDAVGTCPACAIKVGLAGLAVAPGPGLAGVTPADPVSVALSRPHRMLEPLDTRSSRAADPG